MPSSPALGGLDLSALATSSQQESARRNAGAKSHLEASLASMLNEQAAGIAAQGEEQSRQQQFERTQAMLSERMARRAQALQEQTRRERAQYEADQRGGTPNWYEQQRFQTDENIRQAKALRQFDIEDREAAEAAEMPRLSDFGADAINPYKGQAWEAHLKERRIDTNDVLDDDDIARVRELISEYGADPNVLFEQLRNEMGPGGDERASYALWRLGYGMGG